MNAKLYVSQDFNNTIVNESDTPRDEYSRPVRWVIWSSVIGTALICSDFEADALLPLIRDHKPTCTYLICYAAPVTKTMLAFDTLSLYTIPTLPGSWRPPTWLVRDLGLFAGRLYFDFDDQYVAVCDAMGLSCPDVASNTSSRGQKTNNTTLGKQAQKARPEPFSPEPLLFMQEWLAIRRKGQDFSQTMMGKLCQGRRLERDDVVEQDVEVEESHTEPSEEAEVVDGVDDEDDGRIYGDE